MPEPTGYTVDADSFERIARTVRHYESQIAIDSEGPTGGVPYDTKAVPVLIGKSVGNGFHEVQYLVSAENHKDYIRLDGMAYARGLNGGALTVGKVYHGFLYGGVPYTEPGGETVYAALYAVHDVGGSGLGGGTVVVIGALDGGLYRAGTCQHNGTAWVCQPVDEAFAVDVNGLPLETGRRYVGSMVGTHNGKSVFGIQTWWGVVTDVRCEADGLHQTKREI